MVRTKARAVTSVDVAWAAGVSQATVSVVLNGARSNARIKEETRARVLEAAHALGYVPNNAAQSLRRQRSGVIGLVPRMGEQASGGSLLPYQISRVMAQAAMGGGVHLVEASAETRTSRGSEELLRFLLNRRVDGVVFDSPPTEAEVRRVVGYGLPTVQIIRPQFAVPTPAVTVDATAGVDAAIAHLVALGHREIACVAHGGPHPTDRALVAAYTDALARHEIAAPGTHLRQVHSYSLHAGRAGTHALLALPRRPTALFVAGDTLAAGAMHALYEAGVRVPGAMSVVAYNDNLAAYLAPPLTCIPQPFAPVAASALALVMAQIEDGCAEDGDGGASPPHVVLPTTFTVRQSTQRPHE